MELEVNGKAPCSCEKDQLIEEILAKYDAMSDEAKIAFEILLDNLNKQK